MPYATRTSGYTRRTRQRRYRRKGPALPAPKKTVRTAVRTLATRQRAITRNLMTWKSFRVQDENKVLDLSGNLVTSASAPDCRAFVWPLANIPQFYTSGGTDAQKDIKQSRKTLAPYVDRVITRISIRCTHNHAVCIRFLAFQNDGWQEPLDTTYLVQPQAASVSNLFKDFLDKTDDGISTDALEMSNARFNSSLVSTRKHLVLDRKAWIRPFQSPSGGSGGEADTMSLRTFTLTQPIKRRWSYENRLSPDPENADVKSGQYWFIMIVSTADPANAGNAGNMTVDAQHAVIFKENS